MVTLTKVLYNDDDRDEHGNIEGKDYDNDADDDDIENSVNDVDDEGRGGH